MNQSNLSKIEHLEKLLGVQLPEPFRSFQVGNNGGWLEEVITFNDPKGHFVERILTISEILENSVNDCIGIPEQGLIYIGETLMTVYIYICVTLEQFMVGI